MNKYSWFAIAYLALSMHCFTLSEGLDCYNCMHFDGVQESDIPFAIRDFLNLDKSCKTGKKPKSELSKPCTGGPSSNYSCAKAVIEATLFELDLKATIRTCIPYNEVEQCNSISMDEVVTLLPPSLPINVTEFLSSLTDTEASRCICNGDDCNSSLMLKVSSSFWTVSFVYLVVKFISEAF